MDDAVFRALRRQHTQFNGIERHPRVAAADVREKRERVFLNHGVIAPEPLFLVGNGPQQQRLYIFFRERMQFKNNGT